MRASGRLTAICLLVALGATGVEIPAASAQEASSRKGLRVYTIASESHSYWSTQFNLGFETDVDYVIEYAPFAGTARVVDELRSASFAPASFVAVRNHDGRIFTHRTSSVDDHVEERDPETFEEMGFSYRNAFVPIDPNCSAVVGDTLYFLEFRLSALTRDRFRRASPGSPPVTLVESDLDPRSCHGDLRSVGGRVYEGRPPRDSSPLSLWERSQPDGDLIHIHSSSGFPAGDIYAFAFVEDGARAYWTQSFTDASGERFRLYAQQLKPIRPARPALLFEGTGTAFHVEGQAGLVAIGTNDALFVIDTVDDRAFEFVSPDSGVGFSRFAIALPEPRAVALGLVALSALAGIRRLRSACARTSSHR